MKRKQTGSQTSWKLTRCLKKNSNDEANFGIEKTQTW